MSRHDLACAVNHLLLALLGMAALLILFGVWLYAFDANPAIKIHNSPIPVDKAVYRAGDNVIAVFDYCRYTLVPATRYVSFADGLLHNVPPVEIPGLGVGCFVGVAATIAVIPDSLPPGRYYIIGKHELKVNVLATRITSWQTQEFEVVK